MAHVAPRFIVSVAEKLEELGALAMESSGQEIGPSRLEHRNQSTALGTVARYARSVAMRVTEMETVKERVGASEGMTLHDYQALVGDWRDQVEAPFAALYLATSDASYSPSREARRFLGRLGLDMTGHVDPPTVVLQLASLALADKAREAASAQERMQAIRAEQAARIQQLEAHNGQLTAAVDQLESVQSELQGTQSELAQRTQELASARKIGEFWRSIADDLEDEAQIVMSTAAGGRGVRRDKRASVEPFISKRVTSDGTEVFYVWGPLPDRDDEKKGHIKIAGGLDEARELRAELHPEFEPVPA